MRSILLAATLTLAATSTLAPASAFAQAIENRLVIVTSFSKDVTDPFAQAFQKKYPGTRVEVQNRNTNAAVTFIRETRSSPPDIMWASAPDAFEVLKKDKLLFKYQSQAPGLAQKVGTYPINDPDGFFTGFAASGYGIMFNTRYLRANNIPAPKEWDDLKKPIYFGHVGISAPSRSGTTHLTVETVLQGEGWDKGWATLLEIGGNLAQVSDRSFGVPGCGQQRPVWRRHRDRFLRALRQGFGLSGRVRVSERDHDRAGERRHHRQRQEPESGGSVRGIPALG